MHVHLLGDGAEGSGCFVAPFLRRSATYRFLQWWLGAHRAPSLDAAMRQGLARWADGAGLGGAVLLAMDAPHTPGGRPLWSRTQFYTPNDWAARVAAESPPPALGRRDPPGPP